MSRLGKQAAWQAPILLIDWLADKSDEIEVALRDFGNEIRIQAARVASKNDLKEAVSTWLSGNVNAQFLYVGCHGDSHGLFRDASNRYSDRMDYEEFGELLIQSSTKLHLWLGACNSSSLVTAWNKSGKSIPVTYVVGFATEIKTLDVKATLQVLLNMSGCDPVTYVDEELPTIRNLFPNSKVLTFYRVDGTYKNTDYLEAAQWP